MSGRQRTLEPRAAWIHSTRLHVVLYSFLLVFTPFILLRNYLVELISRVSRATMTVGGLDVPIVPVIAAALALVAAGRFRRFITRRWLIALAVVVLMDALAQQITDYYFGHRFYDLQQNWHYIAYGLFAYMMRRDLEPRGLPLVRILWVTWFCALGFSTFDETFQRHITSRVFDVSDISKDLWGCLMGMALIYLGGRNADAFLQPAKPGPRRRLVALVAEPRSALLLMAGFTLIFLNVSALLSDPLYAVTAVGITLLLCAVLVAGVLIAGNRRGRLALGAIALAACVGIAVGAARQGDLISSNRYGLTVYRGLPIPFFDVMLRSDGPPRLVDKKHYFNPRDQEFLLKRGYDILLIGSGRDGRGGLGFPERSSVQFLFNDALERPTQLIILRTPEACRLFDKLVRENKRVLFILHNTC